MAKKEQKPTFEQSLSRLEKIVATLEEGEVSLEDSIALYEEGIALSAVCMETLSNAELRVKKLTKDLDGTIQLTDLDDE